MNRLRACPRGSLPSQTVDISDVSFPLFVTVHHLGPLLPRRRGVPGDGPRCVRNGQDEDQCGAGGSIAYSIGVPRRRGRDPYNTQRPARRLGREGA